jgi:hypothetical protein
MCVELLFILSAPGAPEAVVQSGVLTASPFLWPSALTWVIARGDEAGRIILEQRFPDVRFINHLFYYAGLCLAKTPCPPMPLLVRLDIQLARRFCPPSISGIHLLLATEIGSLIGLSPPLIKRIRNIIIAWRTWIANFGIGEFVRALLHVLIWNMPVGEDELLIMAAFRSAACMMVIVCEGADEMLETMLRIALDVIENDDCGLALNGEGLADFCLIATVASSDPKPLFQEMLDRRKRLADQASRPELAQLGFCVNMVKGAVYVPALREMIEPSIFGTGMMKQEWHAAIDYFIETSA